MLRVWVILCGMRFFAVLTLTCLFSCSAADPEVPAPEGPLGEILDGLCDVLDRCPDGIGRPIAYRNRAECTAILNWAVTCRITPGPRDDPSNFGLSRRMIDVNEADVEACLAHLQAAACEDVITEGNPCSEVIAFDDLEDPEDPPPPLGALNDLCENDGDCAPELLCALGDVDPLTGIDTCTVCRPRPAEGEECNGNCLEGLHCFSSGMGNQRCEQPFAEGTPCYGGSQCESTFCNTELGEVDGWGECEASGDEGEACGPGGGCRWPAFCDESRICQPLRAMAGVCSDPFQCESRVCGEDGRCGRPDGAACNSDEECRQGACIASVCGPRPPDAFCSSNAECPEATICNREVDRCVPPGPEGSQCREPGDCESGFCSIDGACSTRPALGSACRFSYQCDPRHYCREGTCAQRAAPGDECSGFDSCREPFLCQEGRCELISLLCEPAPAGQPCALLRVCDASSYCDFADGFTCKSRIAPGQPCARFTTSESCVSGHLCLADLDGDMTCQTLPDEGEACEGACAEGAICVGRICLAEGPPCDGDECPRGLTCDRESERCVPQRPVGARCNMASDCDADGYCDGIECVTRRAAGVDCNESRECEASLYCARTDEADVCQPRITNGVACASSSDTCVAGSFCNEDGLCAPVGAAGAACGRGTECMSGRCQAWVCLAGEECTIPE